MKKISVAIPFSAERAIHFLIKHFPKLQEAMAFNKFNVFHWHIVDDQSWPLQMFTYTNLTDAAYHPRLVYSQEDVKVNRLFKLFAKLFLFVYTSSVCRFGRA